MTPSVHVQDLASYAWAKRIGTYHCPLHRLECHASATTVISSVFTPSTWSVTWEPTYLPKNPSIAKLSNLRSD
jgi:hypothetical protein